MSEQNPVLTEITDGVMLVTLNRPDNLNAMSKGLINGLIAALNEADSNDDVRAIVITGAGRAFCAGVDLKEISEGGDVLDDDAALQNAFPNCRKPLIGAINGVVVTGGLELALNCDFLYASETARFGDTHAKVGLMPTWGMSQKLSRLIGINRAREMSLSASLINAQTALEWGLINKICSSESLVQEAMDKAKQIAGNRQDAVLGIRKIMNEGWGSTLESSLELETKYSRPFNEAVDFSGMNERLGQVKKTNR